MSEYCENCKQMADRIAEFEQQLAAVTKERDEYKRALYIADSLGNGMFCESCSEDKTCAQCCLDRAKEQTMPTLKEIAIDHAEALIRIAELEQQLAEYKRAFTIAVDLGRGLKSKVCTTCPVENCNRDSAGCQAYILAYVKEQTK